MNHLRTFILLAAMTALFTGVGYLIGGPAGMAIAFVVAAGLNLFSYWNADKVVLPTPWTWPPGPACPRLASASSTASSPTPSPPDATRPTPQSAPQRAF